MESMISVGIDVGTTTTQVIFSRLFLEDTAGYFTVPDIHIVSKQVIYRSVPCETPLLSDTEIDAEAVRAIVEQEYARAHQQPAAVSTGAVIITGESAKKRNASALLKALSALAGDFVVETAGPDLEAIIAGKGSGAAEYSAENRCRVLNVDIGGGTSNAALFINGEAVSTGCIEVGGRHVRTDETGRVTAMTRVAEEICQARGISLSAGESNATQLHAFVRAQTELLMMMAGLIPRDGLYEAVTTQGSGALDLSGGYDAICFSGGVSDAIFGAFASGDDFRFRDLGILLGREIANSRLLRAHPVVHAKETIRATVVGAGSHTTTVSGSTILAAQDALPQRNLLVLRLEPTEIERVLSGDGAYLEKRLTWLLEQQDETNAAVSFAGEQDPSYERVQSLAAALVTGMERAIPAENPLVVVVESDMAKALGQVMRQSTARPVIAIDRIRARAHDRIDIGRPMMDGQVVSVVVKTLVFGR